MVPISNAELNKILRKHRKWHRQYIKRDKDAYDHWYIKKGGISAERRELIKKKILIQLNDNGPSTRFDLLKALPYSEKVLRAALLELKDWGSVDYIMTETFRAPKNKTMDKTRLYFVVKRRNNF